MQRPDPSEYNDYYDLYVSQVPHGDIFDILRTGVHETAALVGDLPPEQAHFRYAPGKWTLGEVIGHVIDA